jgi:hypothetical protein
VRKLENLGAVFNSSADREKVTSIMPSHLLPLFHHLMSCVYTYISDHFKPYRSVRECRRSVQELLAVLCSWS